MALRHFAGQAATALRVRCAPSVHPGFSVSLARLMSTGMLSLSRSLELKILSLVFAMVGVLASETNATKYVYITDDLRLACLTGAYGCGGSVLLYPAG
jgi:hypothetical protein